MRPETRISPISGPGAPWAVVRRAFGYWDGSTAGVEPRFPARRGHCRRVA